VEAAGDVNTLLLDKDRHHHAGNRRPSSSSRCPAGATGELADRPQLASDARRDSEGRSIVVLAKEKYGLRAGAWPTSGQANAHPTSFLLPATRMSGVNTDGVQVRRARGRRRPRGCAEWRPTCRPASRRGRTDRARGGTPLVVAERASALTRVLGVVHLKGRR